MVTVLERTMTAEDIFKILFLMLCDTEYGKATVTKRVLQAVPDDWMNRVQIDKPLIGHIRIKAVNTDLITQVHPVDKNKPVDMTSETIFKILFAVLCFLPDHEVTVPVSVIDKVPKNWPRMLRFDRPGVGLYRLQVKDEVKPTLWENDIMVPITN